MVECHYGVPMAGAVLNAINTRLDAATIAHILDHGEARAVVVDSEFMPVLRAALAQCDVSPLIIEVDDALAPDSAHGQTLGGIGYEALLDEGEEDFAWPMPADEWDAITLNYTSGTTGRPKGVVYHHRGAQLLATGNVLSAGMGRHPVYLWTLPMFHCNGWCFPWTVCAVAGTHVCLRAVRGATLWQLMDDHGVTHMCGAPIVMATMLATPESEQRKLAHPPQFITAGAPPPEAVLAAMRSAGFSVCHVYGLTECYGPSVVNEWNRAWDAAPAAEQAAKMARQGVRYLALEGLDVMDPDTMQPVPADGTTLGEIMMRGNVVMKGYLKDRRATEAAFAGGWFHTGDLAIKHPDGYVQIKRPLEGHHHLRRREYQLHRDRGRALQAPRGGGGGGGREARREMGRDAARLRGAEAGRPGDGGGADRLRQGPARRLQGAARHRVCRDPQDLHRQDPEARAARPGARRRIAETA